MVFIQLDLPKDINHYLEIKTAVIKTGDKRKTIISLLKEKMYSDKIMKEVQNDS